MISARMKTQIVNELRHVLPITRLLKVAGLARSTFYYQLQCLGKPEPYQCEKSLLLSLYHRHKGRYGYRRLTLACRNAGVSLNSKTIRRLMKELVICSLIRVKNTVHTEGHKGEL